MNIFYTMAYSVTLFAFSMFGMFWNFRNVIIMLMCIEMMLLAINMNLLLTSVLYSDVTGQIFVLFVLTVAAAESAIGLAIIIIYYRVRNNIEVTFTNIMKG